MSFKTIGKPLVKKWNANEKNAEQKNVNRSKVKFLKPTLNVKVTLNKNC